MESSGLTDEIQVSESVMEQAGDKYEFRPRGPIEIKGKGLTTTYLLQSRLPVASRDAGGES